MNTVSKGQYTWKQRAAIAVPLLLVAVALLVVGYHHSESSAESAHATQQGQTVAPTSAPNSAPQESLASSLETIHGIPVPPEPDKTTNVATLAGIDSNNNGVRDDVERLVAEDFGGDKMAYQQAFAHARAVGQAIAAPTEENIQRYVDGIRCIRDNDQLDRLKQITLAMLNTAARRTAFGQAFAGAYFSDEGCAK